LATATRPIYVLDDQRRIAYLNPACAAWLGLVADDLLGQRCDYRAEATGSVLADTAARLCPPPEAFRVAATGSVGMAALGNGAVSRRAAQFVPLGGETDDQLGVLVLLGEQDLADQVDSGAAAVEPESARLHRRLRLPYRLDRLLGESLAIDHVRRQAALAVRTGTPVQIVGPPGSGREHVARTIHGGEEPTAAGPLLPLSCPLLDAELLQATVVAFLTRAKQAPREHPATLLLLEADQLQPNAQAEMLAFFRVPTFALRTMATTRRPLLTLAREELFLAELAYRLSTVVIELPPLAQRREDIPLLCQKFVEDFNAAGGKQLAGPTPAVLDRLCAMPWTKNVEELAEVIQEMCAQAEGPHLTEADLTRRVRLVTSAATYPRPKEDAIDLDEFLVEVERELLRRALRQAKDNKAKAARLLGISRARLLRRATQLKLDE
jgi:DNA-binding NtrC family response regulator